MSAEGKKVVSDYIDSVLYADCMPAQGGWLNCDTRQSMCGTLIFCKPIKTHISWQLK